MKVIFLIVIIFCSPLLLFSSDSLKIDVNHYIINLENVDFSKKTIQANTKINFTSKENGLLEIFFWLKELSVDSVFCQNEKLSFNFWNEKIYITLKKSIDANDTSTVQIFYHGSPVKDPTWGGFYFSSADGGYAYNMGVGFTDYPHNYGRVWFPCIDNFTDKASYTFNVNTTLDKKAVCGGILTNKKINSNNTITWTWEISEDIPTYLASVAIANYEFIIDSYAGIEKQVAIMYACLASDSIKLKNSFKNMNLCLKIFEEKFLPYQFSRVGFVVVPFSSGAMEHAMNIAYPKYAVTGNLNNETLMAHEFSHHWWGNLITCSTDADMWINEGWASYSENIFLEGVYGRKSYDDAVRANHKNVLQYCHIIDGDVYPLTPIPTEITYGKHVYDKGADVAHSLRSYLGDSLFFKGIHSFLEVMKFSTCNSNQFRDSLSKYTGVNLNDFFNNWVFEKGFPHFEINTTQEGSKVTANCNQRLRFTSKYYRNVPLVLTFIDENWNRKDFNVVMDGKSKNFEFNLPFTAEFAAINMNGLISEAKTSYYQTVKSTGNYDFKEAMMTMNVTSITDSAFVFVEHHWVGPDIYNSVTKNIRFSDYRYWSVSGLFPENFKATARIKYDGNDYLDHTLDIQHEDSMVLLYRESNSQPWVLFDSYTLLTGSKENKTGWIDINNLKSGDYCLGKYDFLVNLKKKEQVINSPVIIFPNPANDHLNIKFTQFENQEATILLFSTSGKKFIEYKLSSDMDRVSIPISDLPSGIYYLKLRSDKETFTSKIIINK